jgi:hypothetical protein
MGLANLVARTSIAPRNAPASAPDLRKKQGCKADLMKRAALGIDREQLELAERLVREGKERTARLRTIAGSLRFDDQHQQRDLIAFHNGDDSNTVETTITHFRARYSLTASCCRARFIRTCIALDVTDSGRSNFRTPIRSASS